MLTKDGAKRQCRKVETMMYPDKYCMAYPEAEEEYNRRLITDDLYVLESGPFIYEDKEYPYRVRTMDGSGMSATTRSDIRIILQRLQQAEHTNKIQHMLMLQASTALSRAMDFLLAFDVNQSLANGRKNLLDDVAVFACVLILVVMAFNSDFSIVRGFATFMSSAIFMFYVIVRFGRRLTRNS